MWHDSILVSKIRSLQQSQCDSPSSPNPKKRQRLDNPSAKLIARKQEFVAAATSSARLAAYLQKRLDLTPEFILASPSLQAVAESEMLNTPFEWEFHVGQQLANVTPQQARSSPWWYVCHIAWLRSGVFPDPPDTTSKARVNPRLTASNAATMLASASKNLDEATRQLLRRLGGLPHIRRSRGVATDPPIARAYWRHRLAAEAATAASGGAGISVEGIHQMLHHRSSWGRFIERSQLTYSSLLSPRAITAVCVVAASSGKGAIRDDHLQAIARRCLSAHPDLTDWDSLTRAPEPTPHDQPPTAQDPRL